MKKPIETIFSFAQLLTEYIHTRLDIKYIIIIISTALRTSRIYTPTTLQFHLQQVLDHLATGDARSRPQSREVKGTREGIGVTKEEHGRDPTTRVFQGKARVGHPVLLDLAATQVVDGAPGVDLGIVGTGGEGELGALEDVEVVVGGMASGVAFSADGGAWIIRMRIRREIEELNTHQKQSGTR